jgi:hypothetical protein
MTTERRASRAERVQATRARRLVLALAVTAGLAACRQTVVLDPALELDGGAGTSAGPIDATGAGGAGGKDAADASADAAWGGAGTGGGGRDGGRPESGFCFGGPSQQLGVTLRAPDLIIAVDRSAAMQTWWGSGTRLQVIQTQTLALISKYQRAVRIGYAEFPAPKETCNNGLGCCAGEVEPPSSMSYNAVLHVIGDCDRNANGCVQGQRPLGDALGKIAKTFSSLNSAGRSRYTIVLMAGDPTCGGGGVGADGGTSSCDNAAKAVTDLSRDQEVGTAIFGVGEEASGSACLDRLALNGGMGNVGKSPVYRLALTPNDLIQSLNNLVRTMAAEACHIDVRSPVLDPTRVQLYIGNQLVPVDGVEGWTFDPGTTSKITVHGDWCDALVQQPASVELVSGCARP